MTQIIKFFFGVSRILTGVYYFWISGGKGGKIWNQNARFFILFYTIVIQTIFIFIKGTVKEKLKGV